MNPIEYASLARDSKRENEILKKIRTLEDSEKFEFIWRILRYNQGLGLPLVKRANLKPVFLEAILEYGLVYGDASSVNLWYKATVQGLGEEKVIKIIHSHLIDAPLIVYKMLYWLRPKNEKAIELLGKLKSEFEVTYPNFTSTRSTGIHSTSA